MPQKRRRSGRPGADATVGQAPHLRLRLSQLEQRLDALHEVIGNNTDVFAAGFDAADRRIFTMMRIQSDIVRAVPIYQRGLNGEVDFEQYFAEYEAAQALIVLARVHGSAVQRPPEEPEYEESAVIFGGAPA